MEFSFFGFTFAKGKGEYPVPLIKTVLIKDMRKLTKKEMYIMKLFWANGKMFVKDMLELFPEPRPHINTLSTQVRTLEKDGFLGHETFGNGYKYYPVVGEGDFRSDSLSGLVNNFFGNSYLSAVSSLVREDKISVEELEALVKSLKEEQSDNTQE